MSYVIFKDYNTSCEQYVAECATLSAAQARAKEEALRSDPDCIIEILTGDPEGQILVMDQFYGQAPDLTPLPADADPDLHDW